MPAVLDAEGDAPPDGIAVPELQEDEKIQYIKRGVSTFVDTRPTTGRGTLYLTSQNVIWQSEVDASAVLAFHWRQVLMHSICRDTVAFPHQCIYCQVDSKAPIHSSPQQVKRDADGFKSGVLSESAEQAGEDADEESEEDESLTQDVSDRVAQTITGLVRYVLEDNTLLGVLFTVFSQCQALHPDEEEGGEGDFFFDEEEVQEGAASHICMMNVSEMTIQDEQGALQNWDSRLQTPGEDVEAVDDRFADAQDDS